MAGTSEIWCALNTGDTLRLYKFVFSNELKIFWI